ncbi:hypothetical protein F511_23227 [Dorcoceras hygrometricum]|uniref:Uncharacterized protein n=1 Tax=Dorcoceras hygrometricum TaxID=472368 RepID=A0A2Z7BJN3_9LAMI|nr:hypothetical protein F511_23227 [Dorcoceras hygrometricum]
MSLFDLQDVCIVIGSLATLDLPLVVDLIGIYVLKGPYCTLTMTDWFLQALSVISRGSWIDVARRFTMIRWARILHRWISLSNQEPDEAKNLIKSFSSRIAAAGSRRANTRFNKEAPRGGYCYARGNQQREFFVNLLVYSLGNQQREFFVNLLVYSLGNQQREFLTHLLVYEPTGLLVCRLFDDVGATLSF